MIPKFFGKIVSNALVLDDVMVYHDYLRSLNGREVEIVVRKKSSKRSLNQNAYYWGVVVKLLSDHTGHTPDEIHQLMRSMFLRQRLEFRTKRGVLEQFISPSTTELDTVHFESYLCQIKEWAAQELALVIPDPNSVDY